MAPPELRPLGIGEILDSGIKVVVRHWKPLAVCITVLTAPVWIIYVLLLASIDAELLEAQNTFSTSTDSSDTPGTAATIGLFLSFVLLFATFLVAFTACFKAVADAWLGSAPSAKRSLAFGLRRAPRMLWLGIVWSLALILPWMLIVPGIWLTVAWAVCIPALLFERIGAFKSLGRSFGLIKGRWWASFALLLVGYLMVSIIGFIIQFGLIGIAGAFASESVVAGAIAQVIGSTVSSAITYPYLAAVLTILYFDQRVRKEGFDLQLLAEGIGAERDPDAPLPAPLVGDDLYTPEQRAAAPYWPPPPGWVPPPASGPPPPAEPAWSSSSGWSAPSPEAPAPGAGESPLWRPPEPAPPASEEPVSLEKRKRSDWLPPDPGGS